MISCSNLYLPLTWERWFRYPWMAPMFIGMYSKFTLNIEKRMNHMNYSILVVAAFMLRMMTCEQVLCKLIGRFIKSYIQCRRYLMIHLQRDIYMWETGRDIFPFHICKTRWIEDAAWAIQIWLNISQLVKHWLSFPKSKRLWNNKSFDTLVKYHTNQSMLVKFHFFKYLVSLLRPLLVRFQTSKPMVPFLGTELDITLRQLVSLIVRRTVVTEAGTSCLLM